SPRAALRLAAVSVLSNIMSPTCGRLRSSSSPETAPVASISSWSMTSTGTMPASLLPAKRLPTTTTWSRSAMRSAASRSTAWAFGSPSTGGAAGCMSWASAGAPARIALATALASTALRYIFILRSRIIRFPCRVRPRERPVLLLLRNRRGPGPARIGGTLDPAGFGQQHLGAADRLAGGQAMAAFLQQPQRVRTQAAFGLQRAGTGHVLVHARRHRGLGDVHAEIDHVDDRLHDRSGNGVAARAAGHQPRPAIPHQHGRRHARDRPASRLQGIGRRRPALFARPELRGQRKISDQVAEQEPGSLDHHAGAEVGTDGVRVADH